MFIRPAVAFIARFFLIYILLVFCFVSISRTRLRPNKVYVCSIHSIVARNCNRLGFLFSLYFHLSNQCSLVIRKKLTRRKYLDYSSMCQLWFTSRCLQYASYQFDILYIDWFVNWSNAMWLTSLGTLCIHYDWLVDRIVYIIIYIHIMNK